MLNLTFLEIGTSNFDLLAEKFDFTNGMCVEPISAYLDSIPNGTNLIKVNCAIAEDNIESQAEIFWIPSEVIEQQGLPTWLKGCNRIGQYHSAHQNLEHLVTKTTIKKIPIGDLFQQYNIASVQYLRIDTEGSDCKILTHLFPILQSNISLRPQEITFESNVLIPDEDVDNIIALYTTLGYVLQSRDNQNTVMVQSR